MNEGIALTVSLKVLYDCVKESNLDLFLKHSEGWRMKYE